MPDTIESGPATWTRSLRDQPAGPTDREAGANPWISRDSIDPAVRHAVTAKPAKIARLRNISNFAVQHGGHSRKPSSHAASDPLPVPPGRGLVRRSAHRDRGHRRAGAALDLQRLHDEGELVDVFRRELVELE